MRRMLAGSSLSRRFFSVLLVVMVVLLGGAAAARAEPGDELTISVLTFGPGDHPFSKFGHQALLVENHEQRSRLVYNYGTFSFHSIWLVPKFLLGKYRYWLSVQPLDRTIAGYAAENRSVLAQRLRLTAQQKRTVAEFLAWNARDENKYYVFDYYRDNCATRVRDLIDRASGGALARVASVPAEMTWRQHTQRLTADDLPVYAGLYIAMGNVIDRRITLWEEMFLPAKVAQAVRQATIASPSGPASLIETEEVLLSDRRPPPRTEPPRWTGSALALGALGALVFVGVGWGSVRHRFLRAAFGFMVAIVGSMAGLLGCLFLFLWAFTNHEVAHHNENILQCSPFAIALAWTGFGLIRGGALASARTRVIALAALGTSVLGLVVKVLPWFNQNNGQVIALMLPLWTGLLLASDLNDRPRRTAN